MVGEGIHSVVKRGYGLKKKKRKSFSVVSMALPPVIFFPHKQSTKPCQLFRLILLSNAVRNQWKKFFLHSHVVEIKQTAESGLVLHGVSLRCQIKAVTVQM